MRFCYLLPILAILLVESIQRVARPEEVAGNFQKKFLALLKEKNFTELFDLISDDFKYQINGDRNPTIYNRTSFFSKLRTSPNSDLFSNGEIVAADFIGNLTRFEIKPTIGAVNHTVVIEHTDFIGEKLKTYTVPKPV